MPEEAGVIMSTEALENIKTEQEPETENQKDLIDSLKSFLATLIPPTAIVVEDVLGNSYDLNCSVSARNQIKILREFDKIKDMESSINLDSDGSVGSLIDTIISVATDEQALTAICRCFALGHPKAVIQAKAHADQNEIEYENGDMACADLFALEELVTAIVPLFIRLAKRASQALNSVLIDKATKK